MSQTFSLSRFGRLLRTYLIDNRITLLSNILLLAGILSLMTLIFYRNFPGEVDRNRFIIGFLIGWVAWYIFTINQVAVLNEKDQAITYLLQPASMLEKYLLILLISGLGFIIIYITIFTLVDAVGVFYLNHRSWTPQQLDTIRNLDGQLHIKPYYLSRGVKDLPLPVLVFTALLHPVTLAFALLIRRFSLPIVALVIIVVGAAGTLLNQYIMSVLFGGFDLYSGLPFSDPSIIRNHYARQLILPESIGIPIRYVVGTTVIVMFYITAYFRLKEREV